MCLQAELPLRLALASFNRQPGIFFCVRSVHRLHEEMIERQRSIGVKVLIFLRDHHFQFIALSYAEFRTDFRADANPVDPAWYRQGAIGFDCDCKAGIMHMGNQRLIQLQQRFSAGKHHVFMCRIVCRPKAIYLFGQLLAIDKFSARCAIRTDKIGIAKAAYRAGPVVFPAGPEIATAKTAKYGWTPRVGTLALKGIKDFFYAVSHNYLKVILECTDIMTH